MNFFAIFFFAVSICAMPTENRLIKGHSFDEVSRLFSRRIPTTYAKRSHGLRRFRHINEVNNVKIVRRILTEKGWKHLRTVPGRTLRKYKNILANLPTRFY